VYAMALALELERLEMDGSISMELDRLMELKESNFELKNGIWNE
jgi:hypothetical protein